MQTVGFGKRLIAYLVDWIILLIPTWLLQGPAMSEMMTARDPSMLYGAYTGAMLINTLISAAYIIGMWLFANGATIGKKLLGIKVVMKDGSALTPVAAILRFIGYYVSGFICLLGFLWVLWDNDQQGWHDKIASTQVVEA